MESDAHAFRITKFFASCQKQKKSWESTVSRIIERHGERLTTDRKKGSRKKRPCRSVEDVRRVVEAFRRKLNASVRDIGKKFTLTKIYMRKVKNRAGLRSKSKVEEMMKPTKKVDFQQRSGSTGFYTARDKFDGPELQRQ